MNESKVDDIKKLCGYLLVQTTEQSILKDIGFHLETAWRGNSQENKKDNTVQDTNIKREVLNSSQSCFVLRGEDEVYVATSGFVFFNFLKEHDKTLLEREHVLDLTQLAINAQFHLSIQNYKTDFIELSPVKIAIDEDVLQFFSEIRNKSFAYLNNAELAPQYDERIVRNTSVLFFRVKHLEDKKQLYEYLNGKKMPYSTKRPAQGQQVTTISSPFGLLSSQLYHNILGTGLIANVFEIEANSKLKRFYKHILMIDMTSYGGKEGGLVLDSEQDVIGMILPPLSFVGANSTYFSFAVSATTVLELAGLRLDKKFGAKKEQQKKEILETRGFTQNICLIQTQYGHFTGMLVNDSGYVISVRHGLDSETQKPIFIHILGFPKPLEAEIICISSGDFDVSLLRIKENLHGHKIKPMKTYNPSSSQGSIQAGREVMSVGYGLAHPSKQPQVSQGFISKIVQVNNEDFMVQTNTSIQNGCSGGAVFCKKTKTIIGMIMFNLKHISQGNICDLNFALHYRILEPLFAAIYEGSVDKIKSLSIWTYKSEQIRALNSLQTVEKVPQYAIRPRL